MKKFFTFLIGLVLTGQAWAESFTIDKLSFEIKSDNTVEIIGCDYGLREMTLPETVRYNDVTYRVTSIRGGAFQRKDWVSVVIPQSITSIGTAAFSYCYGLRSATIYSNAIGEDAFESCKRLKSVTLGNSVTIIGRYAFSSCDSLTSINIPNSVTTIERAAFYNCRKLSSITIGNSITYIGDNAFSNCSDEMNYNIYKNGCYFGNDEKPYLVLVAAKRKDITSCEISDMCRIICNMAFYACNSLSSVSIGNSVVSIGSSAFAYCDALTSINIPNSITDIGEDAFNNVRIQYADFASIECACRIKLLKPYFKSVGCC